MCSKWVGDWFNHGLYDIHIHLKDIPLLELDGGKELIKLRAFDVMNGDLRRLHPIETVESILMTLESCHHHGFPVVRPSGEFLGMVKKATLIQVLDRGRGTDVFQDASGPLRHPAPFVPYKDERIIKTEQQLRDSLKEEELQKRIDLRCYVNHGCYRVPEHAVL